MNNEFENEVLVRLSVIEEKLTSLEESKSQTYDNATAITMLNKRVGDVESKIKAVASVVVSIIVAVATAGIIYLLKI